MRNIFLGLTLLSGLANVTVFIMIAAALDRRGYKTNIIRARIDFFRYVAAYKELTQKETGRAGPLFGYWVLSIVLTLVFALTTVFLRRG